MLKDKGYSGFFINEDLTKLRSNLLYKARGLVKERRLLGAWTSNGTVLIWDNDECIHRVTKDADLSLFVSAVPRSLQI